MVLEEEEEGIGATEVSSIKKESEELKLLFNLSPTLGLRKCAACSGERGGRRSREEGMFVVLGELEGMVTVREGMTWEVEGVEEEEEEGISTEGARISVFSFFTPFVVTAVVSQIKHTGCSLSSLFFIFYLSLPKYSILNVFFSFLSFFFPLFIIHECRIQTTGTGCGDTIISSSSIKLVCEFVGEV